MGANVSAARDVNLGLVAHAGYATVEDLETVAAVARQHEPRVHPTVLKDRPHRLRRHWLARRPSLFFAARPFRRFAPVRGRAFTGVGLTKSEEYRRLVAAGFRTPRTAILTEHEKPDLSDFGPYVVVKPDVGARGATVKIVRKSRVRWKPPAFESHVYEGSPNLLVQEFIYTGRWPTSYRVQTLFGEALACVRVQSDHDRPPLLDRYAFKESGGGLSIVSSSMGCGLSLCDDEELIDVAERVHALFPECAQLGIDLIREVPSGDVYVLEVNARGGTWMLSTPRLNEACGADVAQQRDGLERAGRLLADAAMRLAE
jgi:hypothetical protein